ncbi:unnamed protein product [Caenorhabditis auriculariae]|uniref:Uncharacterized protein n=1 Tax=Caenorhabditis auriculariae TaxID=2777116 RepID=A0A8S1GXR7_9PELO|nr:unnamed protein product [Caenorhabditis auriculariae]
MPAARRLRSGARYGLHGDVGRKLLRRQSAVAPPLPPSVDIQQMDHKRRRSFEDFASLDSLVADMTTKVNQMAQILREAGRIAETSRSPPSTSSIDQAILLSPVFDSIEPHMIGMLDDVAQGLRLFRPSPTPPTRLLRATAAAIHSQHGDASLLRKLQGFSENCSLTWQDCRAMHIFACSDKDVISYMRILSNETPENHPRFPEGAHIGNTYLYCSGSTAYFFSNNFLAVAPQLPHSSTDLGRAMEVSDTEDELEAEESQ